MNVFQMLVIACIGFYTISYPMDSGVEKKPTLESTFYTLGQSAVHRNMEIISRDEKPMSQASGTESDEAPGDHTNKWQNK